MSLYNVLFTFTYFALITCTFLQSVSIYLAYTLYLIKIIVRVNLEFAQTHACTYQIPISDISLKFIYSIFDLLTPFFSCLPNDLLNMDFKNLNLFCQNLQNNSTLMFHHAFCFLLCRFINSHQRCRIVSIEPLFQLANEHFTTRCDRNFITSHELSHTLHMLSKSLTLYAFNGYIKSL